MEERGIIQQYTTLIDPAQMNRSLKAFILLSSPPQKRQLLIDLLKKSQEVRWGDILSGKYTMIIEVHTLNLEKLLEFVTSIQEYCTTETYISVTPVISNNHMTDYFNQSN